MPRYTTPPSLYPIKRFSFSLLNQVGARDDFREMLTNDVNVINFKGKDLFVTLPFPVFQDIQEIIDIVMELHAAQEIETKLSALKNKQGKLAERFKDALEKHGINIRKREEEWLSKNLQLMKFSLE